MASLTVNDQRVFPAGTSVGAYALGGWLQYELPPSGAPRGSAVASATVDATRGATLTGLLDGTAYYLAGQVGGVWRYVTARTAAQEDVPGLLLLPRPTVTRRRTLLAGGNSTLASGHTWALGGAGGQDVANSNLNYTADAALGDRSIKLQTVGDGRSAWVQLSRLTAFSLAGKHIRVWFKIDSARATQLARITLTLGSGASAFVSLFQQGVLDYTVTGGQMQQYAKPGEWVTCTLPMAGFAALTGTPDWTQIQDLRFQVNDTSSGTGTIVYFGGWDFVDNDTSYPNGVVSFTFDDTYASQYVEARKKLDQYGYAGTAYLIASRRDTAGNMTTAQVQALADNNGWDLSLHANTDAVHNATDGYVTNSGTPQVLRDDWDAQKAALQSLGQLDGINHVAYPQGKFDSVTLAEVRKRFLSARTTIGRGIETTPPGDPMRLRAIQCGDTTAVVPNSTVGTLEWLVDQAMAQGGWLILCFHDIVTSATNSTQFSIANFGTLVDYIATRGIPVRTVADVLRV